MPSKHGLGFRIYKATLVATLINLNPCLRATPCSGPAVLLARRASAAKEESKWGDKGSKAWIP